LYKELIKPDAVPPTSEHIQDQGVEGVSAEKRWGLLPSQLAAVMEAVRTEEMLLKVRSF
jgi:hypothetical protein